MGTYNLAVLPGDGIGPEVTNEALRVLREIERLLDISFQYESFDAGAERFFKTGNAMTEEAFNGCKVADAILMGAIGLPEARHPDGREVSGDVVLRLRFDLDLYAGVRPVKLYEGVVSPLRDVRQGINYVIVRENVEGLYASRTGGCIVRGEVATDTIIMTRTGIEKITRFAFRLAEKRNGRPTDGRKIVTCVDKANVLRSYAYFRKIYDKVSLEYPEISQDYAYVDAMTLYQVLSPHLYDVVVAENMFGDIISDLSSATVGGMGMAPSGDIGDHHAMFQPNPMATILSSSMMLEWLGERHRDDQALAASALIEQAAANVLKEGRWLTADIGGSSSTSEVGEAVVQALREIGS
jgi:3-isopropylmalate dehydrogenase